MTFQMTKCRRLLNESGDGLGLIETLVDDIERAVSQNSNAVFCLAYSLIDTTCKTILNSRSADENNRDDLREVDAEEIDGQQTDA